MQVILLEPIPSLGERGDIVKVSTGYARNFLLPKRKAAPVSKGAMQQAEAARRREDRHRAEQQQALEQLAERIAATSCTITAAANEEGHLYGSVGAADIAEHLNRQLAQGGLVVPEPLASAGGFKVTEAMVGLEEHIKELGVYSVPVNVSQETEAGPVPVATVKVWVVQE